MASYGVSIVPVPEIVKDRRGILVQYRLDGEDVWQDWISTDSSLFQTGLINPPIGGT